MLLGGNGKTSPLLQRELTEIEQKLLDGLFRIILHDLGEAWRPVTPVAFSIESIETEPQLLHILAPNEAVVSVGIEVRIGEVVGMMNIALPSIVIKMMPKFDQQWSVKKAQATVVEQGRLLSLLQEATFKLEARLEGPTVRVSDLLSLQEGQMLMLDFQCERPVELKVNGTRKYIAQLVSTGRKRACVIEQVRRDLTQGRINDEGAGLPSRAADS
jgi:flagellar motor switch protein FliM